jgi:hypothetical protein
MADESAKMLVEAASADLRRNLFGRGFDLDEACGILAEFMFTRYGVSHYTCNSDVRAELLAFLDKTTDLRRASDSLPLKWQPAD